jgi:Scaffold protein Nfu/NifU N terminal
MFRKKSGARKKSLKGYEWTNLLVFLFFIAALAVFVSFVFQSYKHRGEKPPQEFADEGVLSTIVAPGSDTCIFYLGTKLSETNQTYRSRLEIPVTDDGLVRDLFAVEGVSEVVIDQRLVMIQRAPGARWEAIQPAVREVLNNRIQSRQ